MHASSLPAVSTLALLCALALQPAAAAGQTPTAATAAAAAPPTLRLAGRTELPGYTGDFDHFATDIKGNRLFLAAEDHSTLEVFALSSGKHLKTIPGFDAPHNMLFVPERNHIVVIDSGAGLSKIIDGKTYKTLKTIKLQPGADSMTYDPQGKLMYVVAGGKNGNMKTSYLYKVNPLTGAPMGELAFETEKVEAIAIEQAGPHLYVNITGLNTVAVIDKASFTVKASWPIVGAEMNAPMALDEAHHRLFVVTRKPFKLMVLDTTNGATIASFDAPNRTNELMFDRSSGRIFLAGDDFMHVFQQTDPDHYVALAPVPTATGAKTAINVPELKRMFVAISSGEGKTGAAVLRYDVLPAAAPAR